VGGEGGCSLHLSICILESCSGCTPALKIISLDRGSLLEVDGPLLTQGRWNSPCGVALDEICTCRWLVLLAHFLALRLNQSPFCWLLLEPYATFRSPCFLSTRSEGLTCANARATTDQVSSLIAPYIAHSQLTPLLHRLEHRSQALSSREKCLSFGLTMCTCDNGIWP
jgi:hypothetical protein